MVGSSSMISTIWNSLQWPSRDLHCLKWFHVVKQTILLKIMCYCTLLYYCRLSCSLSWGKDAFPYLQLQLWMAMFAGSTSLHEKLEQAIANKFENWLDSGQQHLLTWSKYYKKLSQMGSPEHTGLGRKLLWVWRVYTARRVNCADSKRS